MTIMKENDIYLHGNFHENTTQRKIESFFNRIHSYLMLMTCDTAVERLNEKHLCAFVLNYAILILKKFGVRSLHFTYFSFIYGNLLNLIEATVETDMAK